MDPNEALRMIRLTARQMAVDTDPGVKAAHADEIAEYFEALDGWLSKDGFLPSDWEPEEDKPSAFVRHGNMPMGRALSMGIFAINTLLHPDASADADVAVLEAESDEILSALVELRDIYRETKKV